MLQEKIVEELYDIHSNFRVLLHSQLGFPHKGETAGSMAERILPFIEELLLSKCKEVAEEAIGWGKTIALIRVDAGVDVDVDIDKDIRHWLKTNFPDKELSSIETIDWQSAKRIDFPNFE